MKKAKKLIAGAAGIGMLAVLGGTMAVMMDAGRIDLDQRVGTLDLSADAILSHRGPNNDEDHPRAEVSQTANNVNPGDNDHTVPAAAPDSPDTTHRDGTDHELTIHIQNDGNKSMLTRTLLFVSAQKDPAYTNGATGFLNRNYLKQIRLYLCAGQNDLAQASPQISPAPADKTTKTYAGESASPIPYKEWNEKSSYTAQPYTGNNASGVRTSPDITTISTRTANERYAVLTPCNPKGTEIVQENKSELLVPLRENMKSGLVDNWSEAEYAAALEAFGYTDDTAVLYEIHRNMALSGTSTAPGAVEYEKVQTALDLKNPDIQNYVNKSAIHANTENYIPSAKDYIIDVGMSRLVGSPDGTGGVRYPDWEGATIKLEVVVQAMQFRNTGDNSWETLYTDAFTLAGPR